MTPPSKPIALTIGEPSGVGPELSALAWKHLRGTVPFFVIGDPEHLAGHCPVVEISKPEEAIAAFPNALPVLRHKFPAKNTPGAPDPENAQAVVDVIERSVQLANSGEVAGICTNPIHKKALIDGAGFSFPGHTEFLASLAGVGRVVMMLAAPQLRVVPATIHIPLKDVATALTPALLRENIEITHHALRQDFALATPRIAVAGLNPHAGEGGAMGREELDWIEGLLSDMKGEGFDVRGPMSADTMFHERARETYDVAIAMYHDQALIPIKTLAFDEGVNVTLGLPFVRTSPDHGTALDIAGKGLARPDSLIAALKLAGQMATTRGIA